jgi:branched-chain amino acid aminotransferase
MVAIPSKAPLDASLLTVQETTTPSSLPDSSTLVFGQTFSDHMLCVKWSLEKGWQAPEIKPYAPLAIDPASTVLHYASTLFEGMKVRPQSALCLVEGRWLTLSSQT